MTMRRLACAALTPAEPSVYEHGYERLRRHAVEPGAEHNRHGLAVVALRGLAAWLNAFAELPAPPGRRLRRRLCRCPAGPRSR